MQALAGGDVVAGAEVAGPGFVNLRLRPARVPARRRGRPRAGRGWGRAPAATGERDRHRVRQREPHGPRDRGERAQRRAAATPSRACSSPRATASRASTTSTTAATRCARSPRASAPLPPAASPPRTATRAPTSSSSRPGCVASTPELLDGDDTDALGRACVTWMLRGVPGSRTLPGIRPSLADLRVHFDVWFSEESLHRWGAVPAVMRELQDGGHLVEKDGALFFQAPDGAVEDKDRVVRKSDGSWAYFASDVAYFADKIARGYDRLIAVLGADHHGYVARVRNALAALGLPQQRFEALLYQLVFITKGGEAVKSSKRAGNFVTIDEVMDEIDEAAGARAPAPTRCGSSSCRGLRTRTSSSTSSSRRSLRSTTRSSTSSTATRASAPSSARRARSASGRRCGTRCRRPLEKLVHPDELAMCQKLGDFPDTLAEAARSREPHRIVFYIQELARDFQSYFTRLKGESDPILPPASVRADGRMGGVVGPREDARAPRVDRSDPHHVCGGSRARRRQRSRAHGATRRGSGRRPRRAR